MKRRIPLHLWKVILQIQASEDTETAADAQNDPTIDTEGIYD